MFVSCFRVRPISGKMRLATIWNNPLLPPPGKNPSDAHARLYVDQGFSNFFAHVPLSIKRLILRHFIYAGAIIQLCTRQCLYKTTFFSFQLTK